MRQFHNYLFQLIHEYLGSLKTFYTFFKPSILFIGVVAEIPAGSDEDSTAKQGGRGND